MKGEKIDSLQAIRALAFMGVFFTHCEIIPNLGGWGVSVFFVLSGFLMLYTYNGRIESMDISLTGNIKFAISRMKKIYLLHLIMMLAALPITVVQMYMGISSLTPLQLFGQIILQTTLLQTLIPISSIYYMPLNGLSWYLSVTMVLYFFFPWVMKRIQKLSSRRLILESVLIYFCILLITALDQVLFADNKELLTYFNYVWPLLRLCDFSIGCNFGMIFLRNRGKLKTKSANLLEMLTVLATVGSIWYHNIEHNTLIGQIAAHSTFLYAPTSVALIYLFAEKKGFISEFLTNRLLVYIGDISPYGYLIHQKVIAYLIIIFTHVLKKPLNLYVRALLTVCITMAAIYAYRWLEYKITCRKGSAV